MTEAQQAQQIVDRVMGEMAIRHGSSTKRDFEVASLVLDKVAERSSPSGLAEKELTWLRKWIASGMMPSQRPVLLPVIEQIDQRLAALLSGEKET